MDVAYILSITLSPDARARLGSATRFALPRTRCWRFDASPHEHTGFPWLTAALNRVDGYVQNGR